MMGSKTFSIRWRESGKCIKRPIESRRGPGTACGPNKWEKSKTLNRRLPPRDSSDFDDSWTELIVTTWTFILEALRFFVFVRFMMWGVASSISTRLFESIAKIHMIFENLCFGFSPFFWGNQASETIRTHPNASGQCENFGKRPKTSENVAKFSCKFRKIFRIFSEIFGKCLNASERIQMHPNASERIRMHPNRSEQVRKLQKTCENFKNYVTNDKKFSRTRRTTWNRR